jgi:hypothetical protein
VDETRPRRRKPPGRSTSARGGPPHQAVRLMPRLVEAVAEVLPLVEQLVHVERVAGAAAVRDRGPDEGRRADRFLAYAAQRVHDGHRQLHDRVVGVQDDQLQRRDLVQGDALDAGQHHRGHRLRLDLGEHAVHAELVAAEFLGAHRDRDAGRGRAVGRAEVFVRHPHPTTIPAPGRVEPVDHLVEAVRTAPACRTALTVDGVRPVRLARLIHSVTIDTIHMLGAIHTVHTLHTAAPPDPLRATALDPVGTAAFASVGIVLRPVRTGLGAVGTALDAVGTVARGPSAAREPRTLLLWVVRSVQPGHADGPVGRVRPVLGLVGAVRTLRTVHAPRAVRTVRGL